MPRLFSTFMDDDAYWDSVEDWSSLTPDDFSVIDTANQTQLSQVPIELEGSEPEMPKSNPRSLYDIFRRKYGLFVTDLCSPSWYNLSQ
jgi:hypothetical protein